jgi:hypothetical protein
LHINNNGDIGTSLYEHIAEHSHSVGDQIDYYEDDCELESCAKAVNGYKMYQVELSIEY